MAQNLISASLTEQDVAEVTQSLNTVKTKLHFLSTLQKGDVKSLVKVGNAYYLPFLDKIHQVVETHPEILSAVFDKEEFLKDNPVVNFLKIRASYGIVGNDRYHPYGTGFMDRFLYLPNSYFIGSGYQFGTGTSWSPGAYEKSFGNSGLSWEKSAKQNYGIDFSLFNQKLSGSIDYFYEKRTDILAKASTDPIIHAMSLPVFDNK